MSCNGCRVLRKGCGEKCVLRSSLRGIDSPEAQGNATLFLAKFFGRSDLLSFIASVAEPQRPDLFRSLLYEACGRTVNPVNGAVGLLCSGNWHICEAAVETVLSGGALSSINCCSTLAGVRSSRFDESINRLSSRSACSIQSFYSSQSQRPMNLAASDPSMLLSLNFRGGDGGAAAFLSTADQSEVTTFESGGNGGPAKKLLNLFV